jgi:response regulator RpfG family c-di-GMP phosphodiesterase
VAGTPEAVEMIRRLLGPDVEILAAYSTEEALRMLDARPDLLICNVRFDESRMFDFLQALKSGPELRAVPVLCCRVSLTELAPAVTRAIRMALEALGIRTFIDCARLYREQGAAGADAALRAAILERLGAR